MHGATLIDKQGKVIRPCILWNDTRSHKECEEFENQGATRHSKIFGKIKTQLSKEWREDMDVIMDELHQERKEKESVPASKRKEKTTDDSN